LGEPLELGPRDPGRPPLRSSGPTSSSALDEHRYAAVISVTPHGGARRRDVVVAFGAAALDGVPAASLDHLTGHWTPSGGSVGMAEPLHPRRAVVPSNHLLRALGPRPSDVGAHDVWMEAAHAIDAYRARWHIGDVERAGCFDRTQHVDRFDRFDRPDDPLGPVTRLASLPAAQLADHVRTTRLLDTARARLGVSAPVSVELGLGP
jgi:hypothetical protein